MREPKASGAFAHVMTASSTTTPESTTCPHGKRAGITVCLYCRQDARIAARRRRTRMFVRVGGLVVGAGAVLAVLVAALIAIAPWSPSGAPEAAELAPAGIPSAVPRPAPNVTRSAVLPSIAEGRTDLGDSVFADRAGTQVTVRFDNSLLRTRFAEKFERTVRGTLPRVFGPEAQAALDALTPGTLVRGDLLYDLPAQGIELSLSGGRALMLYPVTRPGEDGPLVVAYRAVGR